MSDGPYETLRAAILGFDLVPGEKLSERGLEEFLGVSRTPVRAALARLENEGLTGRDGRGWRVTPLDLTEVRAIAEYRLAVETAAVALAVERATEAELLALRTATEEASAADEGTGLRDGADFHVALARLSRNPFLADAVSGALVRLARTRWLEVRSARSRAAARAEHLGILDAVLARDAAAAAGLVTAHGRGAADRVLSHLERERRRLRGRGLAIVETPTDPRPAG
ncbi:GntR family transcriptional regulator [Kineococcus sp. SYSU DK001]|uniref:GntR family transcriptional regulator n=1 Tax=Kineococcus sp. SYSU DK001 TaxID=3383122 RepID=UPI003D7D0FB4